MQYNGDWVINIPQKACCIFKRFFLKMYVLIIKYGCCSKGKCSSWNKKKYVFTFTLKIIKDSTAKGGHFLNYMKKALNHM